MTGEDFVEQAHLVLCGAGRGKAVPRRTVLATSGSCHKFPVAEGQDMLSLRSLVS